MSQLRAPPSWTGPAGQSVTITSTPGRRESGVPQDDRGRGEGSKRAVSGNFKKISLFPGGYRRVGGDRGRAKAGVDPSVCKAEMRAAFAAVAKDVSPGIELLEDVIRSPWAAIGWLLNSRRRSASWACVGGDRAVRINGARSQQPDTEIGIRLALEPTGARSSGWCFGGPCPSQAWESCLPPDSQRGRGDRGPFCLESCRPTLDLLLSVVLLSMVGLMAGWRPAHRAASLIRLRRCAVNSV